VFRRRFFDWVGPIEHGFGWSRYVPLALTLSSNVFAKTHFPTIPEEKSDNDDEKKERAHDSTYSRALANTTRGLWRSVNPGHTRCLTASVAISIDLNAVLIGRTIAGEGIGARNTSREKNIEPHGEEKKK